MAYDDRAKATAARLLAPKSAGGKGQAVTITRAARGARDTATGKPATTTTASNTGSGVEASYTAREIDGTNIRVGDKRFTLSPLTTTGGAMPAPAVGDVLTYASGAGWRIEAVDLVSPAGVWIVATLQLRGA